MLSLFSKLPSDKHHYKGCQKKKLFIGGMKQIEYNSNEINIVPVLSDDSDERLASFNRLI